jgi:hypothetical protein
MVVLVTIGLVELFTPSVTNFAAGPYSPLFGFTGAASSSADAPLEVGIDPDAEQSGLSNDLFDDPTIVVEEMPTATEIIPATPEPLVGIAELAAEAIATPPARRHGSRGERFTSTGQPVRAGDCKPGGRAIKSAGAD